MSDAKSAVNATEAAGRASDSQNAVAEEREAAEAERKLGRSLAVFLPATVITLAIVVAVVTSAGPALLVLVAGAILGAIALLWASLRTLGGDAPLAEDMEALIAREGGAAELATRKQAALRALKDLKHEHDIGKIDDADYRVLEAKYRAEAKDVLRELDTEVEPYREKAEAIARKHLVKVGLAEEPTLVTGKKRDKIESDAGVPTAPASEPAIETRKPCPKCETPNDADAAFCKKCGTALAPPPAVAAEEEKHA